MIKALLLLAALIVPAFSQSVTPPVMQGRFLGQDDLDPSISIGDGAQSALNVETSLNGSALLKRQGYSRTASLSVSTSPATGVYAFVDPTGSKQQIVCSDHYCAKSTNNSAFVVFLSTAGGTCMPTRWQFAQISGFLYGVNDCHDTPFKYDGTTFVSLSSAPPLGSIIEATKDRLAISGVSSNPSAVYYSQSGTPANFIIGINSADPYIDPIGANGDQVRALKYALGRFFIFKTNSITSCILGDQYTSKCFPVSNTVGTSDPLSVIEVPGSMTPQGMTSGTLLFRGSDLNFWQLDQTGLNVISRKISNLVASQTNGSNQSNTQNNQVAWQAGTQFPGGSWNTVTNAGSIFPSSSSLSDNTTAQFLLGSCSGCGVSYSNSQANIQYAGVTSTYVWRYDALVLPDNPSLIPYQWTNNLGSGETAVTLPSVAGSTPTIYGSTLTITATAGAQLGNYSLSFSAITGTSTIAVFSTKVEGSGSEQVQLNSGNSAIAIMTVSATQASYFGNGFSPVNESIAAHTYSTYTVIVDSANQVSFFRNGVFKSSGTYYLGNTGSVNKVFITPAVNASNPAYTFVRFFLLGQGIADPAVSNIASIATFDSRIYDLGYSTPIIGAINISSFPAPGTTAAYSLRQSTSPNNDMWGNFFSFLNNSTPTINQRYVQFQSTFTQSNFVDSPGISALSLIDATTGQFVTQCIQPGGSISAWGQLSCSQTLSGGSEVFYATSAATCGALPAGAPTTWQTSVTNNATISISTNAAVFIGWRSLLTSATDQAQVNACTIYWANGTPAAPSWGTYDPAKNAAYWTSAINNSSTSNRILKYDLNLNEWYPFGINATALFRDQNSNAIYFGDSSAGYWNKYGGVTADNGSAINAYWQGRDIGSQAGPFVDNSFNRISIAAKNQITGSMTLTYNLSNNTSNSYNVSLSTTSGIVYIHGNYNILKASPYQFMNIQLGNNSTTPFEIDALSLDYSSFGWKAQNP